MIQSNILGLNVWPDDCSNLISQMLNCELAVVLKAVRQVETSGKGAFGFWYARHSFRGAYLLEPTEEKIPQSGRLCERQRGHPKWTKQYYRGNSVNMIVWSKPAKSIRKRLTLPWSMFQIIGFNYATCGKASVESFV